MTGLEWSKWLPIAADIATIATALIAGWAFLWLRFSTVVRRRKNAARTEKLVFDFDRVRRDDEPAISVLDCMRFLKLTASEVLDAVEGNRSISVRYAATGDPSQTRLEPSEWGRVKDNPELLDAWQRMQRPLNESAS